MSDRMNATYWTAQTHLNEQYNLLPRSETTEVHGRQTADSHRTDAVEQRVDVRYAVSSIAGIKYSRKDQRCESAARAVSDGKYKATEPLTRITDEYERN